MSSVHDVQKSFTMEVAPEGVFLPKQPAMKQLH